MIKKLLLSSAIFSIAVSSSAQTSNVFTSIRPQLEKVINDYPNQFALIKGQQNQGNPGIIEYTSKVELKGAVETKILGYPANKKINWLWEAKLLVTEETSEMQKQYKAYYNDISGKSVFNKASNSSITATGPYSAPSEELRLWSNQFRMNDVRGEFSRLVVDLVAEFENFEWAIYLRVYDKEKDEEIRPSKEKNEPKPFTTTQGL